MEKTLGRILLEAGNEAAKPYDRQIDSWDETDDTDKLVCEAAAAAVRDAVLASAPDIAALAARVAELEAENRSLREAQKACADCDAPTYARVKELEAENKKLNELADKRLGILREIAAMNFRISPSAAMMHARLSLIEELSDQLVDALRQCLRHIEVDETTHGRPMAAGNVARDAIAAAEQWYRDRLAPALEEVK